MSIPKWNEIAGDERFKQANEQEQANIRNKWADDFLRLRDEGDFDLDDKQVSELLTKNGWQPGQVVTALSKRKHERAEQLKQDPDLILPDVRNFLMDKAAQKDGMPLLAGSVADDIELGFQRVAGTALKSLDFVTGGKVDGIHQSQKEHDAYMRWLDATSQTNTSAIEGWKEGGLGGFAKAVVHSTLRELPSFALQIGLGAVSGGLSTGFMGLSSAADKWADVVDDDTLSTRQKIGLIASHAYYEMVMEQLNTIPLARRLGNKASGAVFREMARNEGWKKAMGKLAWQFAKNATEEGLEEFATQLGQDLSDAYIRNGEVTAEDRENAWWNAVESFIGGAAMGGVGLGFEGASYLPIDAATSRNYFQQQLGTLPEKYASKAARQKALDDYELHGTPITVGEPTADDKAMAFAERLVAFDKMDDESRKQYEPYVKEWQDGLKQALEDRKNEPLPQPVNEKGETLGAEEVKDENKPEEPLPKPVDEEGNELGAEEVTEEEPPAEKPEPPKEKAKPEPPKAEPPSEEKPKEPPRWVAEHPNHEKSPGGHYEIVDANDILVSGDEGHLAIMQNRSEGAERTAQINDMSAHPNVSKMFTEGLTDEGAPIAVLRDGKLMVVSGNGRTKARRLMATRRTDMEYLNKLQQWAKDNGVEMPKGMQAPMLLRVIDENLNDEQLKDFVRQANMEGNDKLALDAAERSADDAVGMEKHGDKLIGLFTESEGDAIVSASNKEFVSKFRSLIGQRDGDVDSNGNPTDQFERRVMNAFLGMLLKDTADAKTRTEILDDLVNHADKYDIKGLYRGLAKKSPKLIRLENENKEYGISDILPKVLESYLFFKKNKGNYGNSPMMFLNQGTLDREMLQGAERELFKLIAIGKYQSQLTRMLQNYIDKVRDELSSPNLFGEKRNREQLLMAVAEAEQNRISNGGAAVDAFLDNGSFNDEGMPTVKGARVAESKAANRNPLSRNRAEKVLEPVYMDLTSNPVTDSYVEKIKSAVSDVADKFGVNVIVHRNNDDLPADVQRDLVAFGGDDVAIQAWVDDSDNVVHLVASQMESPEMAVQKTLHEIVGHIGLAALFKGRDSDAWFNMTESLWESHREDIKKRCAAYLNDFDADTKEGRGELVEEWLARLAETNRKPIWWKSIVSKVRALLRACHVDVAYSDADIQQLLADAVTAARRAQPMDDSNVRFSLVTDKKIEQEFNEEGKYIITYRSAMFGDDGKLYPPMATKGGEGMEINKVYKSDEHPELRGKDGKFPLKSDMRDSKASGTVPAAYNPYFHSQAGMLNDQFAVAYDKSKMVTVKCRVLKSDIESGYQAEGAKDPVGYAEWATSGPVTRQMRKRGGRTVILSRYIMPVDIVEQEEVAKWIKDFIGDEDVTIPWNVVNQSLRDELEKIGVKVGSEAEFREAERIKNEKKGKKKGNRFSVARPVQDETSPIPQGPNPPIANIMRQRAARSPISNLRALRLPAIMMLAKQLGSNPKAMDRIKRMPSALGVFREGTREIEVIRSLVDPHPLGNQWVVPQGQEDQQADMIKDYWSERGIPRDEIEIVMKTDEAAKEVTIKAIWHDKSQTLLKKVLGHEIGHLIDYNQGETTTHGNVLGTVGGMGYKYLRKIIGETPDEQIDFEKFEKRKKELHKQAEGLAGDKPKDTDELKAWRETVKAEYANLLTSECEHNGWFQAAVIREELIDNTEWWSGEIGPDPNYRRYRTSPTELFAEAMSVLLNAPEKFAKQLPETWRMLQNYQKERPEFHKAWQGLMRMMNNEEAYTDALMKLAEEGFTADEETEIQIEKEHHDAWRAIKRKIVDSFADVNDASKQLVREGKVTLDETPIANIVSATHQSVKDYYLILAERLSKPLFDAGLTESDIGKYLEFQRIVNDPSINQGHIINPNGMTVNDAKDALGKLKRTLGKEKWELLDKWHKDFWQLRQETIIRLAEESGMYDRALIEHMKKNEWYSYRAVVDQIYNADGTEKRGMSKIYGLKGTLSPIANPLGWTYDHDMRLMGGILWNQARLKTIQFMKEQFPDFVNKVKKFGVVSNHAPDGFTRLAVLENGQYVEYDVAETWAKGFQSQLDRDTATILEKAQWITNLYRRAWTTLSPTFLLNNVVRDYLASYQNLSGINRQIGMVEWTKCWMQGMKEAFKFQFKGESELIEGMMKSNMFQSGGKGYDMSGRSGELAGSRRMELLRRYGLAEDESIRRGAIARFTKYLSDHLGVTWLGDKLGKAVSATEMGAKAGGLIALQRNGEFTDAEKQWHVVRHIGSPDFAQRGTATPIWNTVFIFSNAAIQGWNGTLEMAKANPKGFAARFMATTGMAVFIQWALESGALLEAVKGVMGDDDDEAKGLVALLDWMQKQYGRITHHNRYNYMCLPIAETDNGHCLAFRMPFAENSKLPAMMLHAALDEAYTKIKKDENFKTETGKAIANQAPNLNPVLGMSGDAFLMYVCGVNGYDKYRQRRAVRMKDWEAGGWRRFKGTTAYMVHEYTPFAIVNNMFDLRDNPYWWWNLIGALGPGAWFKFQQYGEAEQSRAVTAEKRRERLNGKASTFYRQSK